MDKDVLYLEEAIIEAVKAKNKRDIPVGAIITYDDKIIARGHNEKNMKNIVTKHAELVALEKANKLLKNWRLVDCTMYVTLQPCPMCASAIEQSRISRLVYILPIQDKENKRIVNKIFKNVKVEKNKNIKMKKIYQVLLNDFFENIVRKN